MLGRGADDYLLCCTTAPFSHTRTIDPALPHIPGGWSPAALDTRLIRQVDLAIAVTIHSCPPGTRFLLDFCQFSCSNYTTDWPLWIEDSIGTSSAGFRENKVGFPQNFIARRYAFLRCFRPGFSVRGSRRGSTGDFRSCSHVTFCVAGINKTFLEKVIAFRQQLWYVLWLPKRRCRNV